MYPMPRWLCQTDGGIMKNAKWISLFFVLIAAPGWAAQHQTSSYSERLATKKNPLKGLSLVVPSFVIHGVKPSQTASTYMPRKMDGNGSAVITPGFGLEYVSPDGLMLLGAVVKDCYDNLAGTLQVGEMFQVSDRTQWGLTFGVYSRQTPQSCSTSSDTRGATTTEYSALRFRFKIKKAPLSAPF